jgi:hypothetical protein
VQLEVREGSAKGKAGDPMNDDRDANAAAEPPVAVQRES